MARDTHLELSLCLVNPSQPVPYTSLFLRYLFKPVLLKLDGSKPMLESFIYLSGNKLHWNGGTYFRVILPRIVHQCSNTWEQADEQFPPSWKLPPSTIGGNHHQSPPSPSQSRSVLQLVFNKECVLCLVWKVCPGSPVVENSFSCFEAYWDISPAVDAPSSEQQSVQVCMCQNWAHKSKHAMQEDVGRTLTCHWHAAAFVQCSYTMASQYICHGIGGGSSHSYDGVGMVPISAASMLLSRWYQGTPWAHCRKWRSQCSPSQTCTHSVQQISKRHTVLCCILCSCSSSTLRF